MKERKVGEIYKGYFKGQPLIIEILRVTKGESFRLVYIAKVINLKEDENNYIAFEEADAFDCSLELKAKIRRVNKNE